MRESNRLNALDVTREKKPGRYADGDNGLYLQVSKWNTRSWIFRYMLNGKARTMGLGSVKYVTLKQARERAYAQRLLLRGEKRQDPLEERRRLELETRLEVAKTVTSAWGTIKDTDEHGPPERAPPAPRVPAKDTGEPPKKRRGPPKGSPKPVGSGRKKATPNATPPAETVKAILERGQAFSDAFQRMLDIGLGKAVTQVGPTGRTFKAPAPIAIQFNALSNIVGRLVPEQKASSVAIDAKAQIELKTKPEPSPRELARIILHIFHQAGLESETASVPLLARVTPMRDHDEH